VLTVGFIDSRIKFMEKLTPAELKEKLFNLLNQGALKRGKFVLSSGKESNYYLDGRIITLSAQGAYLVASIILDMLKGEALDAIGGPTLGADPITGALAAVSYINKQPVKTFIVRKQAKEHGTQQQVEGPALKKGDRVVLVDDVATSGKAILEAKQALDKIGVIAEKAIVIVDRNQGAAENLAKAGLKLESIFKIADFGLG
jgi:orotate phosphoribosyltransferase